ncbi:hypothetical protein CYY_009782 [Polysphondylium violaceum]|uniref:Endoglucanase n=1 Tax=Polysphondylium violaceum TaxID=133409 RepID=A0A8J4PL37_9MYCE|nr:hypothetical protein CYY_009782 [Polysphondylium violaceum]
MYFKNIFILLLVLTTLCGLVRSADDYCDVLQKSLMFYKANRAGRLPDQDVPWRGNSALNDASPGSSKDSNGDGNLSKGYYDAGDHVKFGLPGAYSMAMLGWGYLEFSNNIVSCGLSSLYLDTIKWGTDFIIAAHVSDNQYAAQVGDGNADHAWWGPPELMTMSRPTYMLDSTKGGTEVVMEAAAALAIASMIFKPSNPTYAATCLDHAKKLYTFGDTVKTSYVNSVPNVASFYNSWSGYQDELVWGSIWLYDATKDTTYLNKAKQYFTNTGGNQHSWDNVTPGCNLKMWKLTGDATYKNALETGLNYWLKGGGVQYTPGGLAFIDGWGSARYATTTAFLAQVYAADKKYTDFAISQLSYVLGNNPKKQSFVVGYGPNHPKNPHHRAAHHSLTNNINSPVNNTYLLVGALVGGPGNDDSYVDLVTDYQKNEVALDYNAGFVGLVAGYAQGSNPSTSTSSGGSSSQPSTSTSSTSSGTPSTASSSTGTPSTSTSASSSTGTPSTSASSSGGTPSTASSGTPSSTSSGTGSSTSNPPSTTDGDINSATTKSVSYSMMIVLLFTILFY